MSGWAESFDRDGYVVLRGAIDPEALADITERAEWYLNRYPEFDPTEFSFNTLWVRDGFYDPFWIHVAATPTLLDVAEELIGPDMALFHSGLFAKFPEARVRKGQRKSFFWHQDALILPLDPPGEAVVFWVAIDRSVPESGCLRVIPGSHRRREIRPTADRIGAVPPEEIYDDVFAAGLVNPDAAVDIELQPGDASIHDPWLVHSSQPNRSQERRCGLSLMYIPAHVRLTRTPWPAFLVRGQPKDGVNHYLASPELATGPYPPLPTGIGR